MYSIIFLFSAIQTLQQFLDIQHKRQAHQLQEKMQTEQRQQQQKELLHQLNKGLDETGMTNFTSNYDLAIKRFDIKVRPS